MGRPRTGSLYQTKSGWRARLTVSANGKSVQKSFDLNTACEAEAKLILQKLAHDMAPAEIPIADIAKEANCNDPESLALALSIERAATAGQFWVVQSLVELMRTIREQKS